YHAGQHGYRGNCGDCPHPPRGPGPATELNRLAHRTPALMAGGRFAVLADNHGAAVRLILFRTSPTPPRTRPGLPQRHRIDLTATTRGRAERLLCAARQPQGPHAGSAHSEGGYGAPAPGPSGL